jgi:hypothetical protein
MKWVLALFLRLTMFNKLLKTSFRIVFIFVMAVMTTSCCTEKYCLGSDDMDNIQFSNFSNSDLDTISLQRFSKNSNFMNVLEEVVVITSNFSQWTNYQRIQLPVKLTIDYDYRVQLNTGERFTISDFVSKKETCNTGFMCNDTYNALKSYSVNGQQNGGIQLQISK